MSEEPEILSSQLRTSPELASLFEALSMAQGEISDPAKNKVADLGRGGKYAYADLADLLQIIRPVFSKHGLCILQFVVNPHRGAVTIITRLGHKAGQWMESELTLLVADDKPQALGSMITYGRRYSVAGIAGISPDDDEDGKIGQDAASDPQAASQAGKSSWQSRQPKDEQARQAGAIAAAAAAAIAPPPASVSIFRLSNSSHQTELRDILRRKNVDESLWEAVGNKMNGKERNDVNLNACILAATNESIPFAP